MQSQILENLSPSDALWVFQADRFLDRDEQTSIRSSLQEFCTSWSAHGREVESVFEVYLGRFLLIAAVDPEGFVAGCSNDLLSRAVKKVSKELKLSFKTSDTILWRDGSAMRENSKEEFEKMIQDGEVNGDTIVFNISLSRVGQFQDGMFECQARDSWHSRAFGLF